ncbi:MAG: DUF4198 domain-containing protein [Syntrophobacterales bacterium]|nr:DUF4198 domain-containing protein [Syntrophobacterales bacterium]
MKEIKRWLFYLGNVLLCLLFAAPTAMAHFGVIIPSDDIITSKDLRKITIAIKFTHPMEDIYMEMEKPKRVGVLYGEQQEDLTPTLVAKKGKGRSQDKGYTYWETVYTIKRPGDYIFFVEPAPYWEPAEDKFIIHYTKVILNALGKEGGWDRALNLPIEIIPLTRPYGLWTGNVFQGQVLINGKPAPFVDVEVEYLSASPENKKKIVIPSDPYITQVVKTDANGVFTYAMPKAGWWGFAALVESPEKIIRDGKEKNVEIGGVIWVHVVDMK